MVQRIGRANHRLDEPSPRPLRARQPLRDAGVPGRPRGDRRERAGRRPAARSARWTCWPSTSWAAPAPSRSTCWRSTTRSRAAAPYRDLTWEDFEQVVDFVSTGGYALKTYDRFRRIVQGHDGRWRVRNAADRPAPPDERRRHRLAGRCCRSRIADAAAARRRPQDRRGRGGLCSRCSTPATPSSSPARSGADGRRPSSTSWSARAADKDPKMPSWGGSKFALSTYLAKRVRAADVRPAPLAPRCRPTCANGWRRSATVAAPRRGRDAAGDLPARQAALPGLLSLRGPAGPHHPGHAADPPAGAGAAWAAGLRLQRLRAWRSGRWKPHGRRSISTSCSPRTCWATTSRPGSRRAS